MARSQYPTEVHPTPLPYPTWTWASLLAIAWWLPGLLGHDPWKPEEAVAFGVIYNLLQGGSWIELQLAGEALPGTAPLFYWVCALSAKALGGWLPLHDAARLGAGLFSLACAGFLTAAARRFCGAGTGIAAFLLTLGSIGFIPAAHQMVPGLAMLTGYCVALYGLSRWEDTPRPAGLWLGLGIGIVFLGEGLTHTLVLVVAVILLPVLFPVWRRPGWTVGIPAALLAAAPFLLVWPYVLHRHSPGHAQAFLSLLPHLRDLSLAEIARSTWTYLTVLTWQSAPAWPLALWALWRTRRTFQEERAVQAPLLIFITALLILVHDAESTEGHRLILLPGLILLATRGMDSLRRGASHALMWFSIMFFFLFALTGWYYWMGFDLGFPERLHRHVTRMQPGYEVSALGLRVTFAVLLSAGWLMLMLQMRRSATRPLLAWTAGATLIWGLLMSLYVNYLDTGRSYRAVAQQIRAAVPAGPHCLASINLGASQRAMFHYFGGLISQRHSAATQEPGCDLLLVQSQRNAPHDPGPGWKPLYAGSRLGDKNEWYQLFSRIP